MSLHSPDDNSASSSRRKFISDSLKIAGGATLLASPVIGFANPAFAKKEYTVQDVIDIILKDIPGAPFKNTVDTIKSGSVGNKVSGIVTTMFATVDVIKQAEKLNANFIIAHEPTFYNHLDDVNWVPGNKIVEQKQELLKKNNITVWRFHDQWHARRPDGIKYGVLEQTGWAPYYKPGENTLTIPSVSLEKLIEHLKSSLGINHVRAIGELSQICERIVLMPGAAGGQMQISVVEKEKPDVLVVGEVHEWETAEYIRDARALGSKTALVILGHCVSEEPGMGYLREWLQPKVPGLQVTHIASHSPFTWV